MVVSAKRKQAFVLVNQGSLLHNGQLEDFMNEKKLDFFCTRLKVIKL